MTMLLDLFDTVNDYLFHDAAVCFAAHLIKREGSTNSIFCHLHGVRRSARVRTGEQHR